VRLRELLQLLQYELEGCGVLSLPAAVHAESTTSITAADHSGAVPEYWVPDPPILAGASPPPLALYIHLFAVCLVYTHCLAICSVQV
jgi:hypothetical protein